VFLENSVYAVNTVVDMAGGTAHCWQVVVADTDARITESS